MRVKLNSPKIPLESPSIVVSSIAVSGESLAQRAEGLVVLSMFGSLQGSASTENATRRASRDVYPVTSCTLRGNYQKY